MYCAMQQGSPSRPPPPCHCTPRGVEEETGRGKEGEEEEKGEDEREEEVRTVLVISAWSVVVVVVVACCCCIPVLTSAGAGPDLCTLCPDLCTLYPESNVSDIP